MCPTRSGGDPGIAIRLSMWKNLLDRPVSLVGVRPHLLEVSAARVPCMPVADDVTVHRQELRFLLFGLLAPVRAHGDFEDE